jgi:hypothetical protein
MFVTSPQANYLYNCHLDKNGKNYGRSNPPRQSDFV